MAELEETLALEQWPRIDFNVEGVPGSPGQLCLKPAAPPEFFAAAERIKAVILCVWI